MININGKPFSWYENMTVFDLLKEMGYKLKRPSILIRVNDVVIKRDRWDEFAIPDRAGISVVNLLRGG